MRPYEVMVIFDVGAEPPAIQAVVDRLLETVRTNEGTSGHVDRWGRKPFAYEVKHRREGYYVLVEFAGVPHTVAELDRMLSLADEVVRHKVIRLPEKVAARAASTARSSGNGRGGGDARGDGARSGGRPSSTTARAPRPAARAEGAERGQSGPAPDVSETAVTAAGETGDEPGAAGAELAAEAGADAPPAG